MTSNRFYRNGELVEYTGKVEYDRATNTDWYEIVVVDDSHRIGHKMVTQHPPIQRKPIGAGSIHL